MSVLVLPSERGLNRCAACHKPTYDPQHGSEFMTFCRGCYERLSDEQKSTYVGAVMHVWHAPAGKFCFAQRQLEMVVEDLAKAVAA